MRGQGGDVIVCEEAAFINEVTFYEVILPLLTIKAASLLCISTPHADPYNHFNELLNNDKVRSLKLELVCPSCQRAGKVDICEHRLDRIPNFSSLDARDWVKSVYGDRRQEQYARENLGLNISRGPQCFDAMRVKEVFGQPRISLGDRSISHIFTAIDPCGGSNNRQKPGSDYAVVSIVAPGSILVGAEALDITNTDVAYFDLIVRHFKQMLQVPQLSSARLVVAIENNFGSDAVTLGLRLLDEFPNRLVLMQEKDLKKGVGTTDVVKLNMMLLLREHLNSHQIRIADMFITGHAKADALILELRDQLLRFQEVKEAPKTQFGKTRRAWSGKINGARDDLAVGLMLALYWRGKFYANSAQYGEFF